MNILDENIINNQCQVLRSWRIPFRQLGDSIGQKGIKDEEIISLLHKTKNPTFFSRDDDFFNRKSCHAGYCICFLAVEKEEVAIFIRRFLHHKEFNTINKRKGSVVRITHSGLSVFRIHVKQQIYYEWNY